MTDITIIFIFFILFGLIVAAMGFLILRKRKTLKQSCTARAVGVVERIEYDVDLDSRAGRRTRRSVRCFPVYAYHVNGCEYSKRSSFGTGKPRFSAGSEVTVMYNPAAPDEYYVLEDRADEKNGLITLGIGLGLAVLGIVQGIYM